MSKSKDIPSWRKGAIYWRPLLDGREVTIYPLTFGAARLCVGPLADEGGYDAAYRYESHGQAIRAADEWDPEDRPTPIGFTVIETKRDADDEPPKAGSIIPILTDDSYSIDSRPGDNWVRIERRGKRGIILIEGAEKRDVNDTLMVYVTAVAFERYDAEETFRTMQRSDEVVQAKWPHPDNNDPF